MEVIEKLNKEFFDLQDKYFNLEGKYNRTLYDKVLIELLTEEKEHPRSTDIWMLKDYVDRRLEWEITWDEDDYLMDTDDKTNNLLIKLYNWNEFTSDDWYKVAPWTSEWEYAPYGVAPERREHPTWNIWIHGC